MSDDSGSSPASGAPTLAEGGASAPAPVDSNSAGATPPEGAEAAPQSGASHDPFDGMGDDFDSIDLGSAEVETGGEPGSAEPAPAAEAAPPPAPATAEPSPAPQVPQAPPASVAPSGNVQQPPQSQLEQAMEGLRTAANQTALADWASRELFKLSDDEVQALDTNMSDAIPKLMGKVYTRAMESAVNLIKNLVPEMVNSGITTQQARSARASEALNEFYQANPHLSADKHGAAVDKWARVFRSGNPQAPRAEAIAFVGKAVSAEFGIWPQANGSGAPAARRAAPPFAPARQGARAPTPAKGPHDPYAGMEDEYD